MESLELEGMIKKMEKEDLITVKELCKMLKVSKSWATRAAQQGFLPCYRFGNLLRFKWCDVQDFVEKRREVRSASRVSGTGERGLTYEA